MKFSADTIDEHDQALPSFVNTDIPARLDRLPWSRFHALVVTALGITWILDGLEVTLAGSVAGALKASPVLQFSNADVGVTASVYLGGAVLGALFFGWLTDRLGRKKLFFITLATYLFATAATALSWESGELRAVPALSRAPASAVNMPRSTRPSRSSFPPEFGDGRTSSSMAPSGSARPLRRWEPSCCSIRR